MSVCEICVHKNVCDHESKSRTGCGQFLTERQHGAWIEKSQFDRLCKNCGQQHIGVKRFANFCPNCGADMRKEGEQNEQ